jgi:pyridoxal phosphate-dependent aminotransferase EpsN
MASHTFRNYNRGIGNDIVLNATSNGQGRIYLSPPHMSGLELEFVKKAFASNWIAPVGPDVDAFEKEFAAQVGVGHAAAVSSGTAALHLALRLLGIRPGDEVLCSTLTFAASANPAVYEGATPVFIDADEATWNMNPGLLREELQSCARRGRLPRAVIVVDLYGQCADYNPIQEICDEYGVTIIEDAAEALGATYRGKQAGAFGRLGAFSFNGNKIITTSGGGMLVSAEPELIERARFLASQSRDPAPHYQHSALGYNYRLSNVLASIGRAQLKVLDARVAARRKNYAHYARELGSLPGIAFMPEAAYGCSTRWLSCTQVDPKEFGATRDEIRLALEAENIEARPVWKPLHLQPVFAGCRCRDGATAERIFERGLCLPSGSTMTVNDLERTTATIRQCARRLRRRQEVRDADAGRHQLRALDVNNARGKRFVDHLPGQAEVE